MELRQLRYAVAVADHRHFTRAAASVPVAQPALSHQIKLLEQELGVELFERSRGGVRLTEPGEIFVARARRALAEVDGARTEIASFRGLTTGRLVVGAMQALAGLELPRLLAAFHARYPGIEVSLREDSTRDMFAMVARGEIDLAIAALDVGRPADIDALPLMSEPVLMAVPAAHPLAGEESVALERFRGETFVFFKPGTGLRAVTERATGQAGFTPRVAFETASLDRLLALVSEGLGVALVPASTVRGARLPAVAVLAVSPPIERTVGAVWRAGQRHTPATSAFLALLREHATRSRLRAAERLAPRLVARHPGRMHKTSGVRDPAASFPLPGSRDDAGDRRQANQAVAVSAAGLAATGLIELVLAVVTGSVGLLGDAIHNLSDVSTSLVVFLGFRLSRRPPTESYPYGLERAEDLAGVGIAMVIWASAAFAGFESVRKLLEHGQTTHVGAGIAGAAIGIIGNQLVARYKLAVGRRIGSATLIADARHSWLDALSSAGALAGLIAVAAGQPWGDPVAGLAVTAFICHVGYEVTADVARRLADGIDPEVIRAAEAAAGDVPGVVHAHARARWTGRTLRVEVEGWVDPGMSALDSDALGREVAAAVARQLPDTGSFTWAARAAA